MKPLLTKFWQAPRLRRLLFCFLAWRGSLAAAWGVDWDKTTVSIQADAADERAEATFTFKNTGQTAVKIVDLQTSCGCTVATLDRKVFLPGESGSIQVSFKFEERTRFQHKLITVTTDEPGVKPYALALEVQIPQIIEVHPMFVRWTRGDAPTPQKISIRIARRDLVAPGSLRIENSRFKASLERDDKDGTQFYLVIAPEDTDRREHGLIALQLVRPKGGDQAVVVHAIITEKPAGTESP